MKTSRYHNNIHKVSDVKMKDNEVEMADLPETELEKKVQQPKRKTTKKKLGPKKVVAKKK